MEVILRPATSGYIDFRSNWPLRTCPKAFFHPLHSSKKSGRKCPNVQFWKCDNSNSAKNRRKQTHESSLKSSDHAYHDDLIYFPISWIFREKKLAFSKILNPVVGGSSKIFFEKMGKNSFLLQFCRELLTANSGSSY